MPNSLPPPSRPRLALVLVTLVLAIVALVPVEAASASSNAVGWVVVCKFVRFRAADPIVYPRKPGASHLHAFFGNTTTDAFSTYASLEKGGTSCGLSADKAAYWVPAAYAGSTLVTPAAERFYYRNRIYPSSSVKPFPPGLKIIAGDSHATRPQSKQVVYWDCDKGGPDVHVDHPVNCRSGVVSVHVRFPDCWDGVHTDSADHKSHMAYSSDPNNDGRFTCPKSDPVPVPRLIYSLTLPIHDGTKLKLSSGPYYTMHGDFFNAWVQTKLASLVTKCINAHTNCGSFGLGGS